MFGGSPLVTTPEVKQYPRVSRDSVFHFIETEILASRDRLPSKRDGGAAGRLTKGAANAMLASLYINAGVFGMSSGGDGTNAICYTTGTAAGCKASSQR